MKVVDIVRQTIIHFCELFIEHPYLCYTEHGQHALFYRNLYYDLPTKQRYTIWEGQKVSVVQKEYPTAGSLGKPRRQHWDIAVIKTPAESIERERSSYDYLKLSAVVEFGMNAEGKHLKEDIRRLCHHEANLIQGFIVHLYRLSKPSALFSNRDWSRSSSRILSPRDVAKISTGKLVEIYYGIADSTGTYSPQVWCIKQGKMSLLTKMGQRPFF